MLTIDKIQAKKNKEKITMLTAYSSAVANILEAAVIDIILVGDSLGMVFQGNKNTLSVTIEEMIYHAKAVRKGAENTFIVVDMPFMSYQVNAEETLINAGKLIKESNCNAVKLEGASDVIIQAIRKITDAGIPVMGHLGFTPQSVNALSGYKVQGKDADSAEKLLADAKALEAAGIFSLVLEMVPAVVAKKITENLKIPVISCGAGVDCDGQVLVIDDVVGLYPKTPKFAKKYTDSRDNISTAVKKYLNEVKSGVFPDKEHSF